MDCSSVLSYDFKNLLLFLSQTFQILSSGQQCIVRGNRFHLMSRIFVDSFSSKCQIDVVAKGKVVERSFRVSCSVSVSQRVKFFIGQIEVQHGQDLLELRDSHLSLPQLVEVSEELLNSHSLHYYSSLESLFYVWGVIGNINCLQWKPVFNHIESFGRASEKLGLRKSRWSIHRKSNLSDLRLLLITWEHIFRSVHICAKLEVVDFLWVALIKVLPWDQLKGLVKGWHKSQLLQHSSKLLSRHMTALGFIKVLERGLQQYSVCSD